MQHAQDLLILLKAAEESRIVVSADSDFGTLLADRESSEPSVILFRHDCERRPEKQASVLVQNLSSIESALAAGAVVVFEKTRVRVRPLPIHRR
jgi:predicted nuclease of predicted toxin-antitoxin system